jgi:transposase
VLLMELKLELEQLADKIERSDQSIEHIARENEACQRLVVMPGIGPITATAVIATIGNGSAFRKGRDFSAWLGVVPEEHSTGGKQTLWQIPLRGNQYLRRLFVQRARAVIQHKTKQSSGLSAWLVQLTARTHHNIAIVALANKLARVAWAVLAKKEI